MNSIILIKYGELTTKGDNRKEFINLLYNNIKDKLKNYDVNIIKEHSRMYIEHHKENQKEIIDVLKTTFGIHAYAVVYKVKTDNDEICEEILKQLKKENFKTFKVETKRRDKTLPTTSMDFNKIVASHILKNCNDIYVDVHNPEVYIKIELNKDYTYFYFNEYKGLGGYPVAVAGKGLLMLSGGIDSPVAGYLATKRGVKIDAIYFEAIPHTSLDAREKVITLAKKLSKYSGDMKLHIVPITKLQEEIYQKIDSTYLITILRRMMYRISEEIARKNKNLVLINGESIGQVASQTLTSMNAINEVVKIPVIRPVACFDKLEIIDIAKQIDTYDTSILPYEDCCTIFVPKHPVINPKIDRCIEYEKLIDYEGLIKEIVQNTNTITIKNEDEFSDLL
ncbi:MAG: tRNA 4-thiouridine(8) synthase ThiI [Bacilli bacterium]|nr:tRNA 4-thiouridine(8) synthase ThiI [Bacilli bacterium]